METIIVASFAALILGINLGLWVSRKIWKDSFKAARDNSDYFRSLSRSLQDSLDIYRKIADNERKSAEAWREECQTWQKMANSNRLTVDKSLALDVQILETMSRGLREGGRS